jgi:hypothetical protein
MICKVCKADKDSTEFYINNAKTNNRCKTCKICTQKDRAIKRSIDPEYNKRIENNRKKKWGKLHPEKIRNSRLKYTYGIDSGEYAEILQKQNNVCAICKEKETKLNKNSGEVKRLAVDHCHKTNKIRGLLCFDCNSSLGKFRDSIELLNSAIGYLKSQF